MLNVKIQGYSQYVIIVEELYILTFRALMSTAVDILYFY